MTEEWRAVRGWEGYYEVSNEGNVRSLSRRVRSRGGYRSTPPCLLNPRDGWGGYKTCGLQNGQREANRTVHRLVAEAFLGPRPLGMEINHIDGVKTNNRLSNLEYVTHGDNVRHAFATGLIDIANFNNSGERNPRAKLTLEQVLSIRLRYDNGGTTQYELAEEYSVAQATISAIVRGVNWGGFQ